MGDAKELWPGAGLSLDVPNITNLDAVDRRLDELADTLARITFLKKLRIEFRDAARKHHSDLYLARKEGKTESAPETKSDQEKVFLARRDWFLNQVTLRLIKLESIRKIEREEEEERARRPTKATSASEGIETDLLSEKWSNEQAAESGMPPNTPASDKRGKPAFSAAQSCMAIHYLVHAARELEKIEKDRRDEGRRSSGVKETDEMIAADEKTREQAFERLLVAMTGLGEDAIRKGRGKMFTRIKQTPEDLKLLEPYFQRLGLSTIVKRMESERVQTKAESEYEDDD